MKIFVLLVAIIGYTAAQNVRADPRCPTHPMDARPDIFGDPWNCEAYFRCHNGMSIEFSCPANRHFSTRTNTCEPVHIAGCQQAIAPPRIPPANSPGNRNNNNSNNNNRNNNNNSNSDFLDCPAFDTPGQFVYHAHPNDCQQFFQCSGGRAVLLRCPSGHAWNIQRTFCDQEQNVRCVIPRF